MVTVLGSSCKKIYFLTCYFTGLTLCLAWWKEGLCLTVSPNFKPNICVLFTGIRLVTGVLLHKYHSDSVLESLVFLIFDEVHSWVLVIVNSSWVALHQTLSAYTTPPKFDVCMALAVKHVAHLVHGRNVEFHIIDVSWFLASAKGTYVVWFSHV